MGSTKLANVYKCSVMWVELVPFRMTHVLNITATEQSGKDFENKDRE
jgi:hypothetical protein